ncbi:MAG: CRISPR-associated protein Cas10 [Bacteroidia bacterium]|nr:CRISPR-associated protein Cas10 [Bacteroidia bacterium]
MPKYIVKCDISGIQNFIFDVPSDGAARQLKARSFYIIAITEIAFKYLSDKFPNRTKEIYKGGGNLYTYLEAETEDSLQKAIEDFQREFYREGVFPIFSFTQATGDFKQDMKAVAKKANLAKLQKPFQVSPFSFKPYAPEKWEDFTQELIKSGGFSIEQKLVADNPFSKAGYTFSLQKKEIQFKDKILNKIPFQHEKNKVVEFDEIVQKATGDKKLAALVIDVDNLGSLFKDKEYEEYQRNSQKLTEFFEVELYHILQKEIDEHAIYPVFAGGDDCFLVGAWDKILEKSLTIQEKFSAFARENSLSNTLSAGVVIVPSKFPMVRMAEEAENALKIAKNYGKNGICIFGEVLSWTDFAKAMKIAHDLREFVNKDELPRNLLHRLQSSELGFTSLAEQKAGKIYFPRVHRLMYYLRNVQEDSDARKYLKKLFEDYKEALLENFLKKSGSNNPTLYVIAARWAELLTKTQIKENKN